MRIPALLLCLPASAALLSAQSNVVPGLDGRLTILDNLTYWGSRGTGASTEVGMSMRNTMCNPGSVNIPWYAAPLEDHPKFGFIIVRLHQDRMEQISDWSYCKHAFTSVNQNGLCGTCQYPGTGQLMGLNCSDTYSAGNNASRQWLGPPAEINPWLGTWTMLGSYFDQGDPNVGPPQNYDGQRSPHYSGSDDVYNRVTVKQADLQTANAEYFYGIHLIHEGEAVQNRDDNLASRGFNPQQSGSSWSFPNSIVGQAHGSILQHWPGANLNWGGNGNDDGRFAVAVKTTPLGGGSYHYEYAVHNVDNSRGGASFRVPIGVGGTASNFTFGDIDDDPLNDWTGAQVGNEIVWTAPAGNSLEWNTIYNFGCDCDIAPSFGSIELDQARIGPGALAVLVGSEVPSGLASASITSVGTGAGCGSCDSMFYELMASAAFDLSGSSMTLTLQNGEYVVGAGTATWVAPAGTALTLGDDDEETVTLPFSLPYPGGSTTALEVCSNGFVSAGSNGTGWDPTTSTFVGYGNPCWAALWHDLSPNVGGTVLYDDSTPTSVRITWDAVSYYNPNTTTTTFQYQFEPNGTVHVLWQNVPAGGSDFLVGWTPGSNPIDPGAIDISAALPAGIGLCSTPFPGLQLSASNRPIHGTVISLDSTNLPSGSSFGALLLSLARYQPPLDLAMFGMTGCVGYPQGASSILYFPSGSSHSVPFVVPANPVFTGVDIIVQSFAQGTGLTPIGFVASNGVILTLGPQ